MRFRNTYMIFGGFIALLLWSITDPDVGIVEHLAFAGPAVAVITILLKGVLYVGLLHYSRKGLFDYIDIEIIYKNAMRTPEGAGAFMVGIGLAMVSIAIVIYASVSG